MEEGGMKTISKLITRLQSARHMAQAIVTHFESEDPHLGVEAGKFAYAEARKFLKQEPQNARR